MFRLLHGIHPSSYTHRSYVTSEGDDFSALKAHEYEKELAVKHPAKRSLMNEDFRANYDISTIPRARKIHQSLLTTPVSVFRCLWACFAILPSFNLRGTSPPGGTRYPDLIVTNGPGTAVCVVLASVILRFFALRGTHGKMRTIYVESWARVKRLSLSGRILVGVVDRFLVQWEGLKGVGGRAEYIGVLVS
ncbi:MAG: UDP-N-acetylglucosamine transferase subunit [Pleopsidium flavum]|nr:MAG: UDP-N-acetylglucosamine transferase subunit [Pleopsidium flavum]